MSTLLEHCTEVLDNAIGQEREIKSTEIVKEEVKLCSQMIWLENLEETTQKTQTNKHL